MTRTVHQLINPLKMKFQVSFITTLLVILCIVSQPGVLAKKFGKCDLARELVKNGFSRASLPNWICLIKSESSYNTATIGGPNKNGSKDWGLFQINDGYWCKDGKRGGDCNLNCRCG